MRIPNCVEFRLLLCHINVHESLDRLPVNNVLVQRCPPCFYALLEARVGRMLENAGQWAGGEIDSPRKGERKGENSASNNVSFLKKNNKFTIELVVNIYNF